MLVAENYLNRMMSGEEEATIDSVNAASLLTFQMQKTASKYLVKRHMLIAYLC